ncbi:iron-containing redox enzyme family protein [Pseudomonas sp. HS-18]|uniref:iron-containing redox enzyme family protein n=1 Tax=Pseudomonas sp. HS-18 TaxID=2879114 RepID=UPI001CF05214|nr:iron-containing redox enzyme family protein [Pseudomonas sp. HS-18]UCL85090.1 iron-containing redox enzyme family protein [Pseudomonas sp. HS-18]
MAREKVSQDASTSFKIGRNFNTLIEVITLDIQQAFTLRENEVARDHGQSDIIYTEIASAVVRHNAIKELDRFGQILASRPLDHEGLATFFGTLWAFFKDVPSGIIALAARITDELLAEDTWNATAKAAYVLYASVDEFGLHQHQRHMLPTHHQMFRELTEHLGLSHQDLHNPAFVLPEGVAMGDATHRLYRSDQLGEALGFHLASEMTSSREFQYFLAGFQKYAKEYDLKDEDDPVLAFFAVHCEVEPMHVSTGRDVLVSFLNRDERIGKQALRGAMAFMDGFERMFAALNRKLGHSIQ